MVLELNTHLWKEFKVSDIFVCETTKALDVDEIIDGNIPYITRSAVKNGCSGKLENVEGKINKLNCITIGAEGKFAFYQDQDFLAGVKIYTLRNKNLNKYNALFLCTVLNQHVYKYSYGRARVLDKIKNEYIKLPVDKKGEPDFIFMENYIKELWGGSPRTFIKYSKIPLNTKSWKEHKIGDLFKIVNGIKYPSYDREKGFLPLISTTSNMNGVSDYIADRKEKYKNILTIAYSGSVGVTFYQEKYVFVGETVFALLPKFKMNKYSGLFIATVFNFYNKIFSYGRKIIGTRYKNYSIKLPTKEDGKLDLEYMENYMKKLQFSDLI